MYEEERKRQGNGECVRGDSTEAETQDQGGAGSTRILGSILLLFCPWVQGEDPCTLRMNAMFAEAPYIVLLHLVRVCTSTGFPGDTISVPDGARSIT